MLITIRRRWLLRLFGWGHYNGQQRQPHEYPDHVTASHLLWWHWLRQGVGGPPLNESALSHHKIEI